VWHKPDKTHITREEFDSRIPEIFATDAWIIDGNYNRTIEIRLAACDTVFLFDLPTEVCLEGAISRVGRDRPDMPWKEKELDRGFKEQIESFAEKSLPTIYDLIEKYKNGREAVIFKSREQADEFLNQMS